MPVSYDFTDVRDHELLHTDEVEWFKTTSLFNGGIALGIFEILGVGSITEENAGEVWARLAVAQGLSGAFINRGGVPIYYTHQDIVRRIGLRTNYSTRSRAEFLKTIKRVMDSVASTQYVGA
jgi:hypothetical protein